MVQEGVEREPAQQDFIDRVSAGWHDGRYRGGLSSPDGLQSEIAFALRAPEKEMAGGDGRVARPSGWLRSSIPRAAATGTRRRHGLSSCRRTARG
jgi:hypothetical protein